MNLLRGDSAKLIRGELKPDKISNLFVPRVKPMQAVTERHVVLYAFYNKLPYHMTECPYAIEAMRLDIRDFLINIEEKYPGALGSIRNSMEKITKLCSKSDIAKEQTTGSNMKECIICSEASSTELCKGCQMLEALFKKRN